MKQIEEIKKLATSSKITLNALIPFSEESNILDFHLNKLIDNMTLIQNNCKELLVPAREPEFVETNSDVTDAIELGLLKKPVYISKTTNPHITLEKIYPSAYSVHSETRRIQVVYVTSSSDIGIKSALLEWIDRFGWVEEDAMPLGNIPKGVRFNSTDTKEEVCYILNTFKKDKKWSDWKPFPVQ